MTEADERLHAFLGGPPPAGVRALDDADRAALAELVAQARQRQGAALDAAFETALRHVPFPVRGIVKKVLLG